MDKSTLSNYGWVVIAVLVLSVMIALATPFGRFVGDAVNNTLQGLIEVSDKGMSAAIDRAGNVESGGSGDENQTPSTPSGTPSEVQMLDKTDAIDKGVEEIEVLSFRSSAPIDTLVEVKVDGNTVADTNYTVTEGSTIITFTEEFSKQLAVGTHTIDIVSEEGTASADFDVENSAGLYDANGNQLANWDELINVYGFLSEDSGDDFSFAGMKTLSTVISENSNLASATKLVISPTMTKLENLEFKDCTSLTDVVIPNTVTLIGYYAFDNCTSLKNVNIPSSVKTIGLSAFESCDSLTSITIPSNVTSIEECAFFGCKTLGNVIIENGLITIGKSAFLGCEGLVSITIPKSVTSIGINAFARCNALATVNFQGSQSEWNTITINSGNDYLTNANIVFAN